MGKNGMNGSSSQPPQVNLFNGSLGSVEDDIEDGFNFIMSAEGQQSMLRAFVEAIVVAGGAAAIFGRPVFSQETMVTGLLAGAAVAIVDVWAPSYGPSLRFWPVAKQ